MISTNNNLGHYSFWSNRNSNLFIWLLWWKESFKRRTGATYHKAIWSIYVNALFMQLTKTEMCFFFFIIYAIAIWVSLLIFPDLFLKCRVLLFHVGTADMVTLTPCILWKGRGNANLQGKKVHRLSAYNHSWQKRGNENQPTNDCTKENNSYQIEHPLQLFLYYSIVSLSLKIWVSPNTYETQVMWEALCWKCSTGSLGIYPASARIWLTDGWHCKNKCKFEPWNVKGTQEIIREEQQSLRFWLSKMGNKSDAVGARREQKAQKTS